MKFIPQSTEPTEQREASQRRKSRFNYFLAFCFLSLLVAVGLVLDHRYFKPIRELSRIPDTSFYHFEENGRGTLPLVTHDVNAILFRNSVITVDLLQPTLELPNLWNVEFRSCTVEPEAVALLAKHPVIFQIVFRNCRVPPQIFASLSRFPVLRSVEF